LLLLLLLLLLLPPMMATRRFTPRFLRRGANRLLRLWEDDGTNGRQTLRTAPPALLAASAVFS
jgi:hypothetical protein